MRKKLLVLSLGMFILEASTVMGYHGGGGGGTPMSPLTVVLVIAGVFAGLALLIWFLSRASMGTEKKK